jgi:hypothetical protein
MTDQPEPPTKRRQRDEPQPDSTSKVGPLPIGGDKAVNAVSERLASKKARLASQPASTTIALPDLSERLGSLAHRLKASTLWKAQVDPTETLIDQPSVNFPEPRNSDHSNSAEGTVEDPGILNSSRTQRMTPEPPGDVSSPPNQASAITSSRETVAAEPKRFGIEAPHSNQVAEPSGFRLPLSDSHAFERGGSIDEARTGDHSSVSISRSDAIRVDVSTNAKNRSLSLGSSATSVDGGHGDSSNPGIVGDSRQYKSIESSHSISAIENSLRLEPSRSLESSASLIRNPRSDVYRNFSTDNIAGSGEGIGGSIAEVPSVGEAGVADGLAAGSTSEGGTIDLSRTNELLQQLVDAVRKQRGLPLPVGGPAVYPDR